MKLCNSASIRKSRKPELIREVVLNPDESRGRPPLTGGGFFFALRLRLRVRRFAVGIIRAVSSVVCDVPAAPLENDARRKKDFARRSPATFATDGGRFVRAVHNLKLVSASCASILVRRQPNITSAVKSKCLGRRTFVLNRLHYTALHALRQDLSATVPPSYRATATLPRGL